MNAIRIALVVLGLLTASVAAAEDSSKFQWSITPYAWFPDTTVDLAFQDTNIGSGTIRFKDVLDVVDVGFMLHVEGGRGNWSAFTDITYVSTSDTTERQLLTIDSENDQVLIDAAVAYWPQGVGSPLSLFGGLRYSGLDSQYRISLGDTRLGTQRSSDDLVDALIGVRYRFDLSDKWAILTRADYSAGDSESSFLLRGTAAYTFGQRQQNRFLFGYQHRQAEYKDGDLNLDMQLSGFMAGFDFRF
jgi:hypothetical protein